MRSKAKVRLLDRFRHLDEAEQRKMNKYTWSGLLFILVGFILIALGLLQHTGAYSAEGLLIGIGAIVTLIGILRSLIGFINPFPPNDLNTVTQHSHTQELQDQLFEQPEE